MNRQNRLNRSFLGNVPRDQYFPQRVAIEHGGIGKTINATGNLQPGNTLTRQVKPIPGPVEASALLRIWPLTMTGTPGTAITYNLDSGGFKIPFCESTSAFRWLETMFPVMSMNRSAPVYPFTVDRSGSVDTFHLDQTGSITITLLDRDDNAITSVTLGMTRADRTTVNSSTGAHAIVTQSVTPNALAFVDYQPAPFAIWGIKVAYTYTATQSGTSPAPTNTMGCFIYVFYNRSIPGVPGS